MSDYGDDWLKKELDKIFGDQEMEDAYKKAEDLARKKGLQKEAEVFKKAREEISNSYRRSKKDKYRYFGFLEKGNDENK